MCRSERQAEKECTLMVNGSAISQRMSASCYDATLQFDLIAAGSV